MLYLENLKDNTATIAWQLLLETHRLGFYGGSVRGDIPSDGCRVVFLTIQFTWQLVI